MRPKFKIEEIDRIFSEAGCVLLETNYKNCDIALNYICKCGNLWKTSFKYFLKGQRCKKCRYGKMSASRRRDYKDLVARAHSINLELLTTQEEYQSESFFSNKSKLKVKCFENGHISERNFKSFVNLSKSANCRKCIFGEKHHWWVDGSSYDYISDRKKFNGGSQQRWSRKIKERDDFSCKICGNSAIIEAHHLNSYKWDINNRGNLENGVTLCYEHHQNFHSIFGRQDNTKEQFDQYFSILSENKNFTGNSYPLFILKLENPESGNEPTSGI